MSKDRKRPSKNQSTSSRPATGRRSSPQPTGKQGDRSPQRPSRPAPALNPGGFVVSPETERMFALGHPWVIADRHTGRWPEGRAGDLITLKSETGAPLACALFEPGERTIARVLHFGPDPLPKTWLETRLTDAINLRQTLLDRTGTSAYRLVNGEGDLLPGLTIDRYGDYLMIQLYSAVWSTYIPRVVTCLQKALSPQGIYLKERPQNTRGLAAERSDRRMGSLVAGQKHPADFTVEELGLRYGVDLEEGLDTGLFLDQRENRRRLMPLAKGKRVLNLFSYTCAFSVALASRGGVVTSVDVSEKYLARGKDNFRLNALPLEGHRFIADDCSRAMTKLLAQGEEFDLVVLDPPSFSTTSKGKFVTKGGTADQVAAALRLLKPGGIIFTSSNHQKTDLADYIKEVRNGASAADCTLRIVETIGQPADFPYPASFPEGRYLKCLIGIKGER